MTYTFTFSLFLIDMLIFKQISEKEILRVEKRQAVFFDRLTSLYFFWSTGQAGHSGSRQLKNFSRRNKRDSGQDNSKVCPAGL